MSDVERIDRDDLNISRRELMGGSAVVAGAAVAGVMPRKVAAQADPDNEISGTVTDSSGAVQGATVVAVPHDSSLDPLATTTDANGEYIFDNGDLYDGENLYHVIARDGTEADPRRGQENYPFILANGGADIPDSVGNRWPSDEGSGSTLANSEGIVDISLNFSTWTSGTQYNGGTAPNFDGSDDIGTTESEIAINGPQATLCFWMDDLSTSNFPGPYTTSSDESIPSDGHCVFFEGATDEIGFRFFSGGSSSDIVRNFSIPDASSQSVFLALVIDGNDGNAYAYDTSGLHNSASGTATRGQTETSPLSFGGANGVNADVVIDDPTASTTTALSASEVEVVWANTGANA